MEPAAITAARSVGCRYLEVVTHQPDKQAASTARRTSTARTARRQPRFAAFLISGALLGLLLGFVLSAIVDNVPLVAAAQGMYPMTTYPPDHSFWELLALCAGTGGSILIIGSAAGVSVMGILGIEFGWYFKRMALPATIGYAGGIITFWLMWH